MEFFNLCMPEDGKKVPDPSKRAEDAKKPEHEDGSSEHKENETAPPRQDAQLGAEHAFLVLKEMRRQYQYLKTEIKLLNDEASTAVLEFEAKMKEELNYWKYAGKIEVTPEERVRFDQMTDYAMAEKAAASDYEALSKYKSAIDLADQLLSESSRVELWLTKLFSKKDRFAAHIRGVKGWLQVRFRYVEAERAKLERIVVPHQQRIATKEKQIAAIEEQVATFDDVIFAGHGLYRPYVKDGLRDWVQNIHKERGEAARPKNKA